jgi:single-stranded-DNA-specific exonuclease
MIRVKHQLQPNEDLKTLRMKEKQISEEWLQAGGAHFLDPFLLHNMDKAVTMFKKHMAKNSKFAIIVDQDPDGFCSSASLVLALKEIGVKFDFIFIGEGKTHGFYPTFFDNPQEYDFIIVPDAGTNEHEAFAELAKLGKDVLILDHHEFELPESNLENVCIVNPHNELCKYPNKFLSGSGVTFKFLQALSESSLFLNPFNYLDLIAIATVGDVMDLSSFENKAIINLGLTNITNTFFKTYIQRDGRIKGIPTPTDVSFYIVPAINGLIRVGTLQDKTNFFSCLIGERDEMVTVTEVVKLKRDQDNKKDPIVTKIMLQIQKEAKDLPILIVPTPPNTPKSMTGLIAGNIAGMYSKPTLLGSFNDGFLTGSIRSINDSTVSDFKDFCENSNLFEWVAGHQAACGFCIKEENIEAFEEYSLKNLPKFEKEMVVDYGLENANKFSVLLDAVDFTPHFGKGFEEIRFYDVIRCETPPKLIGSKQNVLVFFQDGIEYIMFSSPYKHLDLYTEDDFLKPYQYKVVGKAAINSWMGNDKLQFIISHIERELIL